MGCRLVILDGDLQDLMLHLLHCLDRHAGRTKDCADTLLEPVGRDDALPGRPALLAILADAPAPDGIEASQRYRPAVLDLRFPTAVWTGKVRCSLRHYLSLMRSWWRCNFMRMRLPLAILARSCLV